MAWETSTRSQRLPKDWARRREARKRIARGMCEAPVHAPGCSGRGEECDHNIPGDDHSIENLRWLSGPCHDAKTRREAAERNRARAQMRLRPEEKHPGAL